MGLHSRYVAIHGIHLPADSRYWQDGRSAFSDPTLLALAEDHQLSPEPANRNFMPIVRKLAGSAALTED
jgi:hypothetical protein